MPRSSDGGIATAFLCAGGRGSWLRSTGMASSCSSQRLALLECLADSPCVLAGRSIKECMALDDTEDGCSGARQAFFNCRRGQLDMRKRIKGNLFENSTDETPPAEPPSADAKSDS